MNNQEVAFYGKGDPLLDFAFASYVRWAWDNPAIREEFERDTKMHLASEGLGAMVDEATGYQQAVVEGFVAWVAYNLWGEANGFPGIG